jgi:uncharacterized protein YggE
MVIRRLALLVVVLGLVVLLAGAARPGGAHGQPSLGQSITVVGNGVATAVPDRADVSFGVQTQRRSARTAASVNATKMQRVIDALRAAGVAAADIQTQQIWISPVYDSTGLTGYIASNTVTVKVRDVSRAGAVIDAAVAAGASNVYGPNLVRSDRQSVARNALRAAIADARAKAQVIAAASGSSLGRVVSVVEQGAVPPTGGGAGGPAGGTGGGGAPAVPTPVQPGEQEINATVSVTFSGS